MTVYTPVDETRVFGCDTSHWSGVVDWNIAKSRGMSFMIAKAMDGINGPTRYFVENYNGAKAAGILTGMYSWLYADSVISSTKQAAAFANLYNQYPTDLPPTIDFEWTASGNPTANKELYNFLIRFEDATGVKPMIYTAWGYWRQYGSTNGFYKNYPLWVAQYGVSKPTSFAPWGEEHTLFQFTDRADGARYGYQASGEKMADMNYFNGTKEQLYTWLNLSEPVDPPIEEEEPPIIIPPDTITLPTTVKIDNLAGLNSRDIPSVVTGKVVNHASYNTNITINKIVNGLDNNVWGETEKGWSCLWLKPSKYFTEIKSFDLYDVGEYEPPIIIIPPETETLPKTITITNASGLNIRQKPTTQSSIVGYKAYNLQITISEIVNGLDGNIWGKVSNGWACLLWKSSSTYFTSIKDLSVFEINEYVAPIETRLFYRIRHDIENPRWGYKSRVITLAEQGLGDIKVAYPQTCRYNGGTSKVRLSDKWVSFLKSINTTNAFRYVSGFDMGWRNKGEWPVVEQLSFGGNVVEIDRIDGDRAYLKNYYYNNENPPSTSGNFYDASIIHYFSVVDRYGNVEGTPVGNVRVFIIANNRNEKLWIPLDQIIKVDSLSIFMP